MQNAPRRKMYNFTWQQLRGRCTCPLCFGAFLGERMGRGKQEVIILGVLAEYKKHRLLVSAFLLPSCPLPPKGKRKEKNQASKKGWNRKSLVLFPVVRVCVCNTGNGSERSWESHGLWPDTHLLPQFLPTWHPGALVGLRREGPP